MEVNDQTSFPARGNNPVSYFMEGMEGSELVWTLWRIE